MKKISYLERNRIVFVFFDYNMILENEWILKEKEILLFLLCILL